MIALLTSFLTLAVVGMLIIISIPNGVTKPKNSLTAIVLEKNMLMSVLEREHWKRMFSGNPLAEMLRYENAKRDIENLYIAKIRQMTIREMSK